MVFIVFYCQNVLTQFECEGTCMVVLTPKVPKHTVESQHLEP